MSEQTIATPIEPDAALGRLSGVNHIAMIVRDMEEAIRFYCGLLGLELFATRDEFDPMRDGNRPLEDLNELPKEPIIRRLYFVRFRLDSFLALIEVPTAAERPATSVWSPFFWPEADARPPAIPERVDHVSFHADSVEDVEWFHDRLVANGFAVSDVSSAAQGGALRSIYFHDPSGNSIEIAAWRSGLPPRVSVEPTSLFRDPSPVPSAGLLVAKE